MTFPYDDAFRRRIAERSASFPHLGLNEPAAGL